MKNLPTVFLLVALLITPVISSAQGPDGDLTGSAPPGENQKGYGLVPCDGGADNPCNACHAVELANTVIEYLIALLSVVAVFMLVIAGFRLVTSGGDVTAMEKAKSMFTNVVVGIILILASWLIVDTVMKTLVKEEDREGFGPWNEIKCTTTKSSS